MGHGNPHISTQACEGEAADMFRLYTYYKNKAVITVLEADLLT